MSSGRKIGRGQFLDWQLHPLSLMQKGNDMSVSIKKIGNRSLSGSNGRLCSATKLENNVSDLMILSLRVLFAPGRNDELWQLHPLSLMQKGNDMSVSIKKIGNRSLSG
jgi:hypothetical protein